MYSHTTNKVKKSTPLVLSIAFASALFIPGGCAAQTLQKGISVQLAVSSNSALMAEADDAHAFIVTVTEDGSVYLGVNPITLPDLQTKVRTTPFHRGQKLYIKADARTPYATVLHVLDATRTGGIATQVLLTGSTAPSTPGALVRPQGVEVQLGPLQISDDIR